MGRIMMNGIQYGTGGRPTAEGVTYDNAESGMTATNVQGALDELNAGLNDWELVGTVTGTTPLTLPADFKELHVNVTLTSNYQVSQTFIRDELNGGWYIWGATYYTTGVQPVFASAYISTTSYTLSVARYTGTTVTNTAVSKVYCR